MSFTSLAYRTSVRGASVAAVACAGFGAGTAHAQDGFDAYAEIEARAVQSDRRVVDGDDVESSGVGASLDAGFEWRSGRTEVQFDLGASIFDFSSETRPTRESGSATASIAHEVVDEVTVELGAGHWEDITTLEARQTDQDAVRLRVTWEDRKNRVRIGAQYREREYETPNTLTTGDGMRYDFQYNRRFGAWHWARIDLRAEDIDSENTRRGYERYVARASYSRPIAKRLRLRPEIEYRRWKYDGRRVVSDPARPLREDSYIAPEIGLAYGGLSGLRARASAAYQFRSSNDPRFGEDAPYIDVRVSYRF